MRAPTCSWSGSGGAGHVGGRQRRASAGASVLVTTKSALGAGNTGRAQGGIQAAVGDDDFARVALRGHLRRRPPRRAAGAGAPARRAAGPTRSRGSSALGVAFTRDDGRLRLLRCGGASRKRLLQAGERTGAEMVRALRTAVRASGRRGLGVDAARRPGPGGRRLARRRGARRQRQRGAPCTPAPWCWRPAAGCAARPTRSALGSTNHPDATPEVLRLALELGAEGRELDSWQRHPTGSVWPEALAGYALPRPPAPTARRCTTPTASASSTSSPRATSWPRRSSTPCEAGRGAAAPDGSAGVWLDTTAIDRENGGGLHRRAPRLRPQPLPEGRRGHHHASACSSTPCSTTATEASRSTSDAATTLPGLFAAGEIAGGRPRLQPPDGQLPARHRRLRAPRRARAPRRSSR